MHLVSENSPRRLEEKRLLDRLRRALRELAANLMRITRGAGKPYEVVVQAAEVAAIVREYEDLTGHGAPVEVVSDSLAFQRSADLPGELSDSAHERILATEQIVEGALQIAASQLLGQMTHATRGHDEMLGGTRRLRDLNEKERLAREEAERPALKAKPSGKRKSSVKPPSDQSGL